MTRLCIARCILRGDRFRLPSLASHADRAMRALTARSTASSVYANTAAYLARIPIGGDPQMALAAVLEARPGWLRLSERDFVHRFGRRQSAIALPPRCDETVFAALVIRAEVSTLLGDCEWRLLTHLQALAASELQRLRVRAAAS